LEAKASIAVMKQAVKDYGKPEIINSDQGSPFTCEDWISYLESEGIEISMDGKGRAIDNIFIERFRRSVKYDYVYLHPADDGLELYQGLKDSGRMLSGSIKRNKNGLINLPSSL
jgi:putative transposase